MKIKKIIDKLAEIRMEAEKSGSQELIARVDRCQRSAHTLANQIERRNTARILEELQQR